MKSHEIQTLKDCAYFTLIHAQVDPDPKLEKIANDALEIIERLEAIVEQLDNGDNALYEYNFDKRLE